ncbi:hypothetical protein THAOC_07383 [Thalassiosira oceanica]|uniref:Uncharacterized protein n=1 Tax=Thalassiosira oceanica TaxID=159749 RepID=K0T0J5_THAOC|nr:hypothetical protein THAOC_07383 [Thalassiosira oceanica]|eukprot:EJK71200.1 hypothetical protein THAOC_07383 [Thalassiosira oceanica]
MRGCWASLFWHAQFGDGSAPQEHLNMSHAKVATIAIGGLQCLGACQEGEAKTLLNEIMKLQERATHGQTVIDRNGNRMERAIVDPVHGGNCGSEKLRSQRTEKWEGSKSTAAAKCADCNVHFTRTGRSNKVGCPLWQGHDMEEMIQLGCC